VIAAKVAGAFRKRRSIKGGTLRSKTFVGAACLASGVLSLGGVALLPSAAFAKSANGATNGTTHCDPSAPSCGQNPVLTGPPPPFVTIPSSCPSFLSADAWSLDFIGGNSVSHGTLNKNGAWGGDTSEGQGELTTSDGTVQYVGHLQEWGGGGQNTPVPPAPPQIGQTENGFTLNFNGSGIAGNVAIHVNGHSTTNNNGTPTSNHMNVSVACS